MFNNPFVDLFDQRDPYAEETEELCPDCMTNELKEGETMCEACYKEFTDKLVELRQRYPKKYWDRFDQELEGHWLADFLEGYDGKA